MTVRPNALSWLVVSAIVIVLDQLTKAWVLATLPEYTAVPVIDGFWNWYRSYNTGAAFSFLSDAGAETAGIGEDDIHQAAIIALPAAAWLAASQTGRCRWPPPRWPSRPR